MRVNTSAKMTSETIPARVQSGFLPSRSQAQNAKQPQSRPLRRAKTRAKISSSGFHDGRGNPPALRQRNTLTLQDAIQQPLHGFEPGDVRVGFLLLPEASSCQRSGGVTLTPKPFSRWRISSRRKPQACARRRTFNSIGRVAPLPANSHRFRQHAQPFPIADCGSRRTAFGSQFTYSDPYYSS